MKIFKFGGTSVKDADAVRNVVKIIQKEGVENTLIVVSAMGKMTNAFEKIVDAFYNKSKELSNSIRFVEMYHQKIIDDLFDKNDEIHTDTNLLFGELSGFLATNTSQDYNFLYDQIVSFGELLSTKIMSAYLSKIGIENNWLDVRNFIKTDSNYRDAKVKWELTEDVIKHKIDISILNITQGFLAGNNGKTTTLGREGSDYTAAIFAYCLEAESVTIWKDVEGVLNADPRVFTDTQLLTQVSYTEAIEMAFYGASVIHPKTLQPIEKKRIPLFVRSFIDTKKRGTKVSKGVDLEPKTPCFVVKKNQTLVSISAKDFSFMVENNISYIFKKLHQYKLKVNVIQNSAISFSVCIEDKYNLFNDFYNALKTSFNIKYNVDATLYTIRHFDKKSIKKIEKKGTILLKQTSSKTVQIILK